MKKRVVIVGGGFTGLSAAFELSKDPRYEVTIVESASELGGLASTFEVNGVQLEKFYHHWFTSDHDMMRLIDDLGASSSVQIHATKTGTYYANRHYRLSTPLDLLRFDALSVIGRIRLGIQTLHAGTLRDWRRLEGITAEQWIRATAGSEVYEKVWAPLLEGKFGPHAHEVGAVWFWNKLKLRGGSRGKGGREELAYFQGGFAALIELLSQHLRKCGVRILTNTSAVSLRTDTGNVVAIDTSAGSLPCDSAILTPALPVVAKLLENVIGPSELAPFNQVDYLGNVCLILNLNRSLSNTYWLNVNDSSFPFVGVIEHTNFIAPSAYHGAHLVYLSKYVAHTDPLYAMSTEQLLHFALPYLEAMFPEIRRDWVTEAYSWRARYAQPVVTPGYSERIPPMVGPLRGCYVASMAQIYPEDRGTNYAVRQGREVARYLADAG